MTDSEIELELLKQFTQSVVFAEVAIIVVGVIALVLILLLYGDEG